MVLLTKSISNFLYSIITPRINENLEKQLHLIFAQIFNGISTDVILGDVVETTSGGTPSRKHSEYYENGTLCWVKSKELLCSYIHDTEEHINNLALSQSSAKMLPKHSVLIAMYGATVGAYGIISKPMACNQAICALLSNERYPYTYLFQIAHEKQQKLINMAVGSAQQNISQVLLKQLPLHSDASAIKKFHVLAQPLHKQIEQLQAENKTLSETRDILLPKLMNGEIDVSNIKI
ncbi:MAG: restriction endonuclease subunit S [Oscillospiraceae bacterium]|nr:restriction endonuclease subunit S [Oscillospiraceae bacterium]